MATDVAPSLRCRLCGAADRRLDQSDRCEQCVIDAEHVAGAVLDKLERFVADALAEGVTVEQLRGALEMSLADAAGPLAGSEWRREPVETSERAIWHLAPPSAFCLAEDEAPQPNMMRRLRCAGGIGLEALAAKLRVSVGELALWEQGALMPDDRAQALAAVFGVSVAYLLGEAAA
jgi:DNA-binding transcriptional regulator YiaG